MRKNKYRLLVKCAYHLDKANALLNKANSKSLITVLAEAITEMKRQIIDFDKAE
jgi:predicted nucleic acid-binding protein